MYRDGFSSPYKAVRHDTSCLDFRTCFLRVFSFAFELEIYAPGDNPLLFSISGTGSFICPVA